MDDETGDLDLGEVPMPLTSLPFLYGLSCFGRAKGCQPKAPGKPVLHSRLNDDDQMFTAA